MDKVLHIITLNIPYPADYGGMIDTWYRIRALHSAGINIHLHCFSYGRYIIDNAEEFCSSINYYKRRNGIPGILALKPYIVESRKSDRLLENLLNDDYPILFDGIHTTHLLDHPLLANRRKFVRTHNIEHRYYRSLASAERNPLKKLFYYLESIKLRRYERILSHANRLLTISSSDQDYFMKNFGNAILFEPWHPFENIESMTGKGDYILFHGDLSVSENEASALFLCRNVFRNIGMKCIIAGKNPSRNLEVEISGYGHIKLVSNPSADDMDTLIKGSHIIVIYAGLSNGFRIKLLCSLFEGRFVVANKAAIFGSGLGSYVTVCETPEEIINEINRLKEESLTEDTIRMREALLKSRFNNLKNAGNLSRILF